MHLPVVEILKVGLSGLVFMLAFMAYRLLAREQGKSSPDEKILRQVRWFYWQSVLLVSLLAGVNVFEKLVRPAHGLDECRANVARLQKLASSEKQTVDSLRLLIERHISVCGPALDGG